MNASTTRRGMLSLVAATPMIACGAAPAVATAGVTPFRLAEARYWAATKRFEELPSNLERDNPATFKREEDAFHAAVDLVDSAPCADWNEFGDAYEIACDGGESLPNEDLVFKLLADVRRLSRRAAS